MDTIKQRAEEYAQRIKDEQEDAYIFTDAEVLVEGAYEAGAREERNELLRWRDPRVELPKVGENVLVQIGGESYFVGYLDLYNCFCQITNTVEFHTVNEVLGWRYIVNE